MKHRKVSPLKHHPKGLTIIYEDTDILVVDKPPGLLSVRTEKETLKTAHYYLTDYVRKGCAKSRKHIFVVHRLDRETSGVLIFAKHHKAKLCLQDQWEQTEKKYLAVVYGQFTDKTGTISSYLVENKDLFVHSTQDQNKGKLSHTAYTVLRETKKFSLLEVRLLTGRKNQIRVHLAESGHPIVGDEKYGKADQGFKRLALHAQSISFKHPINGQKLTFETQIPPYFSKLVGQIEQKEN